MAFKTSDEAIGFLSQFIKDSPLSNSSGNSLYWKLTDEIHIITELFREEIPEEQQHKGFTMDDDIIMVRRITSSGYVDTIWLVTPFEGGGGGGYGSRRAGERGGVVYCSITDIGNFKIYRFDPEWRNPYDFWKGVHEGFGGNNERYFRLEPKNTNPRTLNFSRRGFQ